MEKTRTTRQKQLITDILRASPTPMTAAAVFEQASAACSTLAKSTVYRNLEAMVRRGELERGFLETGEGFFYPAGREHHHYMICSDCHKMQDLKSCPMEHLERDMTSCDGFIPRKHVVQVYGYCRECATKHTDK